MPYTSNSNIAELLRRRGEIEANAEYQRGQTAGAYAQIAANSIKDILQYQDDAPRRQAEAARAKEQEAQFQERAHERLGSKAQAEAEAIDFNSQTGEFDRQKADDYLRERGFPERAAAVREKALAGDENRVKTFYDHLSQVSSVTGKAMEIAKQIKADHRLFDKGMGVIRDIANSLNHPELAAHLPKTYDPATFEPFMQGVSDLAGQFEKQRATLALVNAAQTQTTNTLAYNKAVGGALADIFSDPKDQAGWDAATQLAKGMGIPDDRIASMGGFDDGAGPRRALEQQLTPKERMDMLSVVGDIKGNQSPEYNTWVSLVHDAQEAAVRDGKKFTKTDADKLWLEAVKRSRGPEKPGSYEEHIQTIEARLGRKLTEKEQVAERRTWALADDAARRQTGVDDPWWAHDRALYEDYVRRAEHAAAAAKDANAPGAEPIPPPMDFPRWRYNNMGRGAKPAEPPPVVPPPKQPAPDISGAAELDRLKATMAAVQGHGLDFTGRPLQAPPAPPPPPPPGQPPPDTRTVEQRMGMPSEGPPAPPPSPPGLVPTPVASGPPPMPPVVRAFVQQLLAKQMARAQMPGPVTDAMINRFWANPQNQRAVQQDLRPRR